MNVGFGPRQKRRSPGRRPRRQLSGVHPPRRVHSVPSCKEAANSGRLEVPPVRCWPHHFDLDTLVTIAPGRTTGIGFSPGDEFYNEPYFYVSLDPEPDEASLLPLPAIGHWHRTPFTAAIATARRIVEAKDQKREVEGFLHEAMEIAIKVLS
jgi:hypothetical protein